VKVDIKRDKVTQNNLGYGPQMPPFPNANGQGYQGVPEYAPRAMLPPRHQQPNPGPPMYAERPFPDQGFEGYSPHLGPAHMMSPQLYGSPVMSQIPPLHMTPPMGSYLPPNGYYNAHIQT